MAVAVGAGGAIGPKVVVVDGKWAVGETVAVPVTRTRAGELSPRDNVKPLTNPIKRSVDKPIIRSPARRLAEVDSHCCKERGDFWPGVGSWGRYGEGELVARLGPGTVWDQSPPEPSPPDER